VLAEVNGRRRARPPAGADVGKRQSLTLAKVNRKATDEAASRRSAWPEGELEEGDGADSDRFFCFRRRLAGRQVQTGPAVE
jgi:hypothetical protein